jgi:hypothetical protein
MATLIPKKSKASNFTLYKDKKSVLFHNGTSKCAVLSPYSTLLALTRSLVSILSGGQHV